MNIYEVAEKAGVSIATVSRVINNSSSVRPATRQRVEAALKELNYRPNAIARSLAVSSTQTIGVLASDVRDSYYASAIYILEQEFRKNGYHVILCNTGGGLEKRKKYLDLLLEKKVDGMVLVGSIFKEKNGNPHILDASKSVPIVMLNSSLQGENIYSVVCDDQAAVVAIVDSLARRGHRELAYVYDVDSFSGIAKLEGFYSGLKKQGLPLRQEWIVQTESGVPGGRKAWSRLDEMGACCSAVITSEDILAAGIVKELAVRGKGVPDDVAVFGYNHSTIAQCTTPELSTVDNKVGKLAKESVKILCKVLRGEKAFHQNIIVPELIFRGSCP